MMQKFSAIFTKIFGIHFHSIARNLLALGAFQLMNYLTPLLILPYLIRVIGINNFGMVSFCQAIMAFFLIVVDYGFNLTSTRQISLSRDNPERISEIFSNVFWSKFILTTVVFVVWVAMTFVVKKLNDNSIFYISGFLFVVGQTFFPVWFFQGLEKMQYITVLNLISKLVTLACIFLLIKSENDFILVLPLLSAGGFVSTLLAIFIIGISFKIKIRVVERVAIWKSFKEGASVFFAHFSVSLYSTAATVILGFFCSNYIVGCFSSAEKVAQIPRQILGVFVQSTFPKVCQLTPGGYSGVKNLLTKLTSIFQVGILLLCCTIFFLSKEITFLLTGSDIQLVTDLIKLFVFVPFIVCFNISSYLTLLAYNLDRYLFGIMGSASVVSILFGMLLSHYFAAQGTIINLMVTEGFIALGLYLAVRKMVTHKVIT